MADSHSDTVEEGVRFTSALSKLSVLLPLNEKKVLKRVLMALGKDYSINEIAKKCSLAPNGALKILRKFENLGVLK